MGLTVRNNYILDVQFDRTIITVKSMVNNMWMVQIGEIKENFNHQSI